MALSLTLIGTGRLGKTLGRLWHRQGAVEILDLLNRTRETSEAAQRFIGAGQIAESFVQLSSARLFLLAVPDDQIAKCAEQLVRSGQIAAGTVVFHCSGALPSSVLRAAAKAGASIASIHPIRSFADPEWVSGNFTGTFCGMEGDEAALTVLAPLFLAIGAKLLPIHAESKTLYHAAAVFASNYVVSLLAVAQQSYIASGIPATDALALLGPLVRETVDNILRQGPAAALTGPIARGDLATVASQQLAVQNWDADYGLLYLQLASATTRLAASRNTSPEQTN